MKHTHSIIGLILVIALLFLSGCSLPPSPSPAETEETADIPAETYTSVTMSLLPLSFEECLEMSTHIISATFTGEYEQRGRYFDLTFTPVSVIKGTSVSGDIHVRVSETVYYQVIGTGIQYTESMDRFQNGKTYTLILQRTISVYEDYDVYAPLANLIISSDGEATIYNSAPITDHADHPDAISASEDMTAYIQTYLQGLPPAEPTDEGDYIRSTELSEIVPNTTYILKVTPLYLDMVNDKNRTEQMTCQVDEVLKGAAPDDYPTVIFQAGTVEIGATYIVLVERMGESSFYTLSSKNSVHEADDTATINQIKALIAAE